MENPLRNFLEVYTFLPHMPRYRPSTLQETSEFGIDMAAKLTGVPEHNLRIDFDRKLIQGVRRTPGGKRLISREGLAAYLKARGYDPKVLSRIDRRDAERIGSRKPKKVRLEVLDPRLSMPLGQGEGTLVDLSATGFQAKEFSWKGHLPGPDSALRFRVLGGELKNAEGEARISWILYREGALRMGLKIEAIQGSGTKRRWVAFVAKGIETEHRVAEELLSENLGGSL